MTDWTLIRKLVNTAIDTCEQIEASGVDEMHRNMVINEPVTMNDFLISSWVAPENLSRKIIGKSYEKGHAKPYCDELSRTMLSIGRLCSELVKLENIELKSAKDETDSQSIKEDVDALCHWYTNFCLPNIKKAMTSQK